MSMILRILFLTMTLFGFNGCKSPTKDETEPKILLMENFNDDSKGWINRKFINPALLQKIENGMLYLESSSDELGVMSYINLDIKTTKDFSIETKLKIKSKGDIAYSSLDFGILKKEKALRNINGISIPTTWGDENYYFGYSDLAEVLIAKWNKGNETYYFRQNVDSINIDDFNKLFILKKTDSISYYLNDIMVYKQPFQKLIGNGIGFSTAPNSILWVDYIKITN